MSPYALNCLSIQRKRSSLVSYFSLGPGGIWWRPIEDAGCPTGKVVSNSLVGESDNAFFDLTTHYSALYIFPACVCSGYPQLRGLALGMMHFLDAEQGRFRIG